MSNQTREEVIVQEHLAELRGRVRMLTWVSGLSWLVLVLFGGLLVTGMLDWLIHFDDPGLRLVIGLTLLTAASAICWRRLILPLIQPMTMSFLAQRIEGRFPGLHGRVLSAVEFLQHKIDPRQGSAELQRSVIKDALRDLDKISSADIVESKSVKRITIAGAILSAMIATVVILHPVEAATSVKRLMFPFANCPWPRQYQLKLVKADLTPVVLAPDQPILIARGDTLELYVVDDRGRIPERVWFEYRIGADTATQREPLRQTSLRDERGRSLEAAVISWVATRGPLQFRATGGDDDTMSFLTVNVVQPPVLQSLRVTVTPPAYSGRVPETLPPGVGHVQGLLGTQISIEATADKLLKSAKLRVADKPAKAVELAEDKVSLKTTFTITDPGVTGYWFELVDTEGFSDPEAPRFELRGIADAVPDVIIEQPVADMMLAADAELMVKVLAKDDLALRSVRLSYTRNDDTKQSQIPLANYDKDEEPVTLSTPDYLWKLAELSLEPGQRIVFRAEATDAYDLGNEPHIGRSSPRTITIVSKEDKQKELAGRVGDLLEELQQAATLQQRARQQTSELRTQLNTAGNLRTQDLDQLHRIELDQRQAASRLNRPADGVQSQARQLQNEFQANKLDDTETQQRLNRIIDELSRLDRDQFPEIESALTRASKLAEENTGSPDSQEEKATDGKPTDGKPADGKSADGKTGDGKSTEGNPTEGKPGESGDNPGSLKPDKPDGAAKETPAETVTHKSTPADAAPTSPVPDQKAGASPLDTALTEAHAQQTKALEKLQQLQDLLSEWRDQRDVSKELNSLIAEQEKLQKDSAELGQQTLSKSGTELSAQQKADLAKTATRQLKVAERVDQFRKQLQQASDSLQQRDPDAAERFNDARDELNNDGIAGKLREAAQGIAENQMGTASQIQQQALEQLRDLDKQLKREPTEDVETLIKQIDQVQNEVEMLRKEQADLKDLTKQASGQPDSPQKTEQLQQLRQRQEALREKVAQAERRLERLRLRSPAEAAERAQERLDRINEQLQDPEMADEAAEEMQQVLDDLEQVQRDLALEKRVAQERLAVEELEKMEDQLKALVAQQEQVIQETERLSQERQDRGTLSRAQLKTLHSLSEVERGLQSDAEQMEKSLKTAEVFSLVLRRTARSLKLAADRLANKQVDASVLVMERDALKKIQSLLVVLRPDEKKPQANQGPMPPQGQDPDEPPKPQQAQPPGEALPQLAQLKLLKSLQEEYLERTQQIDMLRDQQGQLPEEAAKELEELAQEQAELADLTRDLVVKLLQSQPEPPATGEGTSGKREAIEGEAKDDQPDQNSKPDPKAPRKARGKSDLGDFDLDDLDLEKQRDKTPNGKRPGKNGE